MAENYVCDECNIGFRYKTQIIKHIQMHNQQSKEYFPNASYRCQCKHCGRRFTEENHLETHTCSDYEQNTLLTSKENSEIEVKQEVISVELNLSLDNLNTETTVNDNYGNTKFKNDLQDVTSCLDGSKTEEYQIMIRKNAEEVKHGKVKNKSSNSLLQVEDKPDLSLDNSNTETAENVDVVIKIEQEDFQDATTDDKCLDSLQTGEASGENDVIKTPPSSQDCHKFVTINKEKRHSCYICHKKYASMKYVRHHIRTYHSGEIRLNCSHCEKTFVYAKNLEEHMEIHKEKPNSTDVQRSLVGNMRGDDSINAEDLRYSCSVCNKKFDQSHGLIEHMRKHTGEKPYSCDICHKTFSQSSSLRKHVRIHTGEKPFSCEICNKKFYESSALHAHKRIHTGAKPYSCDICHKKFTLSSSLSSHLRLHTGEKPYSCDLCDKRFNQSSCLQKHIRTHTGEKPYGCNLCDKKFSSSSALNTHLRVHTGEKPYICDICHKTFTVSSSLTLHRKLHTGAKPYSCDICDKKFTHANYMQKHKKLHLGEKPYSCDICKKKFTASWSLKSHVKIHTGVKPYSCDICHRKFSVSSTMQTHMRIHTGERPYSCDICNKKFTAPGSLKSHLKLHTVKSEAEMNLMDSLP